MVPPVLRRRFVHCGLLARTLYVFTNGILRARVTFRMLSRRMSCLLTLPRRVCRGIRLILTPFGCRTRLPCRPYRRRPPLSAGPRVVCRIVIVRTVNLII